MMSLRFRWLEGGAECSVTLCEGNVRLMGRVEITVPSLPSSLTLEITELTLQQCLTMISRKLV